MNRLIIKIKASPQSKATDFEVTGIKPIGELVILLAQSMDWPTQDDEGNRVFYWLETREGPVNYYQSCTEARIHNGDLLLVRFGNSLPEFQPPVNNETLSIQAAEVEKTTVGTQKWRFGFEEFDFETTHNASAQERRAPVRLPANWKKISAE